MLRALCLSVCLLTAAPAVACINDKNTAGEEEEFRSRYDGEKPEKKASSIQATLGTAAGTFVGLLLCYGALRRAVNPTA